MKTASSDNDLSNVFNQLVNNHFDNSRYIGDMGFIKVMYIDTNNTDIYFFVNDEGNTIGFANTVNAENGITVENVYVVSHERNKKVLSSFILFLKRIVNVERICFGKYHSPLMVDVIKRLSKRYHLQWFNTETGDIKDYSTEDDEPYYKVDEPSDWEIILEEYDNKSNWQRYMDVTNIKQTMLYESFIDDLDDDD